MPTERQVEQVRRSRWVRWLSAASERVAVPFGLLLQLVPGIGGLLDDSLPGRVARVGRLLDAGQFPQAFAAAQESLAAAEARRSQFQPIYWWMFLNSAARAASELGSKEQAGVEARLAAAPQPGGAVEAAILGLIARWRWKAGDRAGALERAQRAVQADPTSADSRILLAWLGQQSGKLDPLPLLREAVRLSPTALGAIRAIPEFAAAAGLVAALESNQTRRAQG